MVNNSQFLKEAGLDVRVRVGDKDSSTIAAVRRGNPYKNFKLSDRNHLKKSFSKDLFNLEKSFKKMKKKNTIPHKKCFGHALAQNTGNSAKLASTLRSTPDHLFNQHENCSVWCHSKDENSLKKQKVILQDPALYS